MIDYLFLKLSEMALRAIVPPTNTIPWVYWVLHSGDEDITYYSVFPTMTLPALLWDAAFGETSGHELIFPPCTVFMRPEGRLVHLSRHNTLHTAAIYHGAL